MFIVTTCRGHKTVIVPRDIAAFTETGKVDGGVHVYLRGDETPFRADCTFEEFLEMYETALNSGTPGHISSTREVPQAVVHPQAPETPEQRAHRLGRLDKFQQDLRLMFPEAYVFVMNPEGHWVYNTKTSVVSVVDGAWKAYGEGVNCWKTVDSGICDQWREELRWLHWGASMFYGQRYELQADTFEPFVGREP